jgi:hypothetical protein
MTDRLETALRAEGGIAAAAEITRAKPGFWTRSSGASAADQVASAKVTWKLQLRVTPDGEEPFDAEVKAPYPKMGPEPRVGQVVGVLFDPSDRSRIAIDHSAKGQATQALSHLSPTMQSAMASALGESAEDVMEEAIADPKAFREKMLARRGVPPVVATPRSASVLPTAPASPTDELAKLADLRDRGALTEEEFQEQKRRVLGG